MRNGVKEIIVRYQCDGCPKTGDVVMGMVPEAARTPMLTLHFQQIPEGWIRILVDDETYLYHSKQCGITGLNSEIVMHQVSDTLPYDAAKQHGQGVPAPPPPGDYDYPVDGGSYCPHCDECH